MVQLFSIPPEELKDAAVRRLFEERAGVSSSIAEARGLGLKGNPNALLFSLCHSEKTVSYAIRRARGQQGSVELQRNERFGSD